MQVTSRVEKPILALGLVFCTIGILLAFNFENSPMAVKQEAHPKLAPIQDVPKPVVSTWYSPLLPQAESQHPNAPQSISQQFIESEVIQIVMILGLAGILMSGLVIVRRRKPQQSVDSVLVEHPDEEAARILEMNHEQAREAIDGLSGTRRIEVLRSIVELGDPPAEQPVVQVLQQEQLELTECG